jgi:spore coat protein JC
MEIPPFDRSEKQKRPAASAEHPIHAVPVCRRFLELDYRPGCGQCQSRVPVVHCGSTAGTEELGHLEMIGAIVHQLTRNLSEEEIKTAGFDTYFVDRTTGVYPTAASGFPWSAASMAVKGDVIADLTEDLAAEQKARVTYDNILRLSDDPDVNDVIRFLREREIVHFQRFGEAIRLAKDKMDQKNIYFINPAFDK